MVVKLALAAAALALGAGCVPSAGAEPIEIGIEHSAFEPGRITVSRGETVTFIIRNGDPIAHEFILGEEEIQDIHENGTEAHHGARPGEVSIPPGATRTTTYTFTEPGELIFGCHLPGHYDYGMRGAVEVK